MSSTRGVAGQRLMSSRRRRAIVDFPTATDPATATTNGVVVSGSCRNALVSAPEALGGVGVEAQQAAEGQVDLAHLGEVEHVAEAPDLHDLGLGERLLHVGGEAGPLGAVDLAVQRERRGDRGWSTGVGCGVGRRASRSPRSLSTSDVPDGTRPGGGRATLHACASESSTSARTPSTCSSPM